MAVHRVGGHDPAVEREQRLDLVAGGGHFLLAQHQALPDRPGAHQVQRPAAALAVEAAPGRLAVDGDDRTGPGLLGKRRDEAAEAGLERVGIEQAEDPREGVVTRDAAFQAQQATQQWLLGAPEQRHVDAAFGAAQHRRQRDQQDLQQIVALGITRARVDQILKARPKPLHAAILLESQGGSTVSTSRIKKILQLSNAIPLVSNV